jgi:hypothetical protein
MSITSKPVGLGANPLSTLSTQLSTLERKLNKLEAQLVRAATASAPQATQAPQTTQGAAAADSTGFIPFKAAPTTPGSYQTPRSLDDIWKMAVGPETPNPSQGTHPAGSLKADPSSGVITTPGGYKIEQLKQFDWLITGPDGKTTKIWGDPHVAEGDGGKWDFKRDSTFVLGDGTRINVTTKPWGNDMTVTGGLEVISGNDRVLVTDIDKGKGKVGQVTQDGFQHVNSFGGKDVFVMGKESDDWSFQGKEIIGSNNGGESFKLGNALAPGNTPTPGNTGIVPPSTPRPGGADQLLQQMRDVFKGLADLFKGLSRLSETFARRNQNDGGLTTRPGPADWLTRRHDRLRNDFDNIGRMIHLFKGLDHLSKAVQPFRNNFTA